MNKNKSSNKARQEAKDQAKFNSITNKKKVENQNQTHNAKKEGITPMNRNR